LTRIAIEPAYSLHLDILGVAPGGEYIMADITSGFKDAFHLDTNANQQVEIGRLALPAGAYSIWAKLFIKPSDDRKDIQFRLQAEGDFDITSASRGGERSASVALNVVHNFAQSGNVVLTGAHQGDDGETDLGFIKITAVRAASLQNNPLP
jgi:hypothetical protein